MTEYTTPPAAYGEYMTSRERTAYWVQAHSSQRDAFYSPSVPPDEIEDLIPSSPPSEVGSSYSLPPKMVLKYSDGRPDIPIPHVNTTLPPYRHGPGSYGHSYGTGHPASRHYHSRTTSSARSPHSISPIPIQPPYHSTRTGSHGSTPSHPHPGRRHEPLGTTAGSPEEIRVLPSRAPSGQLPPRSATASHSQRPHHRSRSLPRTATDQILGEEEFEPLPTSSPHSRPSPYPHPPSHHPHPGPQVPFGPQGGPAPWAGVHSSSGSSKRSHGHPVHKVPPAMVYAPSRQGHHPHYAPPPVLYHQPQRGPNGMIYSHSAPVPTQGGAYPPPMDTRNLEQRGRRDRTRSLGPGVVHKVKRSDGGEDSDAETAGSGSTYYILPTAGQKLHVIPPSPEQSVVTATSTTKSPGPSPRKPFFQRLFNFAKIAPSTGGSAKGPGRKLQRRHSTGDSGRPRVAPAEPIPESQIPE